MKYIRTKENIIDIEKIKYYEIKIENDILKSRLYCEDFWAEEIIIKQADTIEELCDEFVLFGKHIIPTHSCYYDLSDIVVEKCLLDEVNVYGAIWTDKGLIYVAKMNSEGKLELL